MGTKVAVYSWLYIAARQRIQRCLHTHTIFCPPQNRKNILLSSSAGSQGTVIISGHFNKPTHPSGSQLELSALDRTVECYFSAGLAASTSRVYSAGINKYLFLCHELSIPPTPASEHLLCKFVTYLALNNISSNTIKVYLSGVRQLHYPGGSSTPAHGSHAQIGAGSERYQDIPS